MVRFPGPSGTGCSVGLGQRDRPIDRPGRRGCDPRSGSEGICHMTQFPDLFAALGASFESQEVRVRSRRRGASSSYITARTAMNRLDSVLGPENWWDEYVPGENSVICRLTVRLPDGSTLTKADAGGYAGMADQGDDDKSGFSDAFKRAAVKFGVGPLPVPRRRPSLRHRARPAARPARADRSEVPPTSNAQVLPPRAPAPPTRPRRRGRSSIRPAASAPRNGPGPLRLDEGPGAAPRGRPLEVSQRLGQAPGLPGPDGRLGRTTR